MKSSLWVISELYYPESTSTGYILTRIAEGLSHSYDVKVICAQPNYSARGTRSPLQEEHNGVFIRRCWGTTLNKDILPLRLVNLVTITISIFVTALVHLRKNDMAIVVTNPPTLPFAVAIACKLKGARCSMIVHDVYPELAIAAGKLTADSFFARLLGELNGWLYRRMSRIFVLGRDMQEKIAARLNTGAERVVVATNWADLDLIKPTDRDENDLLRELGITGKFVLQYAGNMGYPNDIETIIEAASLLKGYEDIHFVFIGSGAKKSDIEYAIERDSLTNVTILGQRPRSDQTNFLNACDVALIALVSGMKGVSVPSRTYNTLAAGKPIIAIVEAGSELALIVEEKKVGWVVNPGHSDELVSAILNARDQRLALIQMGKRARSVAEEEYSFSRVLQVFQRNVAIDAKADSV